MTKPRIAVFAGPNATIGNTPTLVTSNKGRISSDRPLPEGRYDHLVSQRLYEPVTVRIRKFSAHPLEEDAKAIYQDNGKDYYEVELRPEDGPYLLPYMARRADGSADGAPFDEEDLYDPAINFGGRQFFYPDATRMFEDIDRTIAGRDENGHANMLGRQADYDFIRALPSGGYTQKGEIPGEDYFYYKPFPLLQFPRYRDLARVANSVQTTLASGKYAGGIWLDGSPTLEEAIYWLSLLVDSTLPIAGVAAQRPHGQLGNDGDRNIVDAVSYILSGRGKGLGAVAIQEEQVFAARELKKADDRPGNYKVTGGAGGILGNMGPPVRIWYRPAYKHTSDSEVNLSRLKQWCEFPEYADGVKSVRIQIKNSDGTLRWQSIPRIHMVKYGAYMDEDNTSNPDHEVDILARIEKGLGEEQRVDDGAPPFHGFVFEGLSPYGVGSNSQREALAIAAYSGMPVVSVGRADPGGPVPPGMAELMIPGSNLDANKARMLLMAAMLKLGRLPKAGDPRRPSAREREKVIAKIAEFQELFDSH